MTGMDAGPIGRRSQAIIEIADLSMRFGDAARPKTLDGVDLSVEEGEFVSIVGASGCGKSTLLRLVSGLLPPTEGSVSLGGLPPREFRRKNHIGFVFQDATLLAWRTALGNVMLPLEILHIGDAAARRRRALAELERVRLSHAAASYPGQLSGGMRQRVSIARALAYDPAILLMDEPFGALDEITRGELNDELLRLWAGTGKTTLFVTHSLSEALYLSDRVVVMAPNPGRITLVHRVDLPRPRTPQLRRQAAFLDQLEQLETALAGLDQRRTEHAS
jgi:NitT/TauT family transport system ATP-binding protein